MSRRSQTGSFKGEGKGEGKGKGRARPHQEPDGPRQAAARLCKARRGPLLLLGLGVGLSGCLGSCPSSEDGAAQKRIWGPEEPSPTEQAAATSLDVDALARDAVLRRHVLYMSAEEMAHRLGSFEATNKVKFSWKREKESASLQETAILQQAGNGDFRVTTSNDHDAGMELRWVAGVVYEKTLHGKFFERRPDRAGHLRWREAAMEQLQTLLQLTGGRIALAQMADTRHEGREAARYLVTNTAEPTKGATPPSRPEWSHDPIYPKGEAEASLAHRLAVMERGKVRSVTGELLVDKETGVILRFSIDAELSVPAASAGDGEAATLRLKLSRTLKGVVGAQLIERPKFEPFSKRPRAIMNPLAFWPDTPKPTEAVGDKQNDKADETH